MASIPVKLTGNRSIVKEADLSRGKEQFFSDRGWVNGSVTGYRCLNCGRKLSLRGHVWERAEVVSAVGMYDYCDSAGGGYVTGIDHLFQLHHNGSLRQVHDYPSHAPFEACTRVTSDVLDLYTVTACENSGNVNLYLTSYAGRSGFTMGPFESQALEARKLQSTGRVIMLADVSRYPQFRFRTGAVHLFDVSTDPDGPILEELEVIDSNDLQGTQGWDQDLAFFGNADLSFTEQTDTYRLLVTELDSGLFTVHFTYHRGSKEISVRQTSFLDVNRLLAKHNYSMPFNSHFAAVRVVGFEYDAFWDYEEVQVLVTTNNFHSFVLNITYDSHGVQIEAALTRVLLKYGYYNTNNYVKALDGLVALGLTLPQEFHWIDYLPKQQLVIFDVRRHQNETWNSPPAELHFIGSTRSNSTFEFTFDFNFTVNRHNETFEVVDLGLLAVDPMGLYLREYRVSRNLSLIK